MFLQPGPIRPMGPHFWCFHLSIRRSRSSNRKKSWITLRFQVRKPIRKDGKKKPEFSAENMSPIPWPVRKFPSGLQTMFWWVTERERSWRYRRRMKETGSLQRNIIFRLPKLHFRPSRKAKGKLIITSAIGWFPDKDIGVRRSRWFIVRLVIGSLFLKKTCRSSYHSSKTTNRWERVKRPWQVILNFTKPNVRNAGEKPKGRPMSQIHSWTAPGISSDMSQLIWEQPLLIGKG